MAQVDTELLTEHLGYAPVSLLDSIINVVNSLADRTLDRVEQGLSGASAKTLGFEKALRKKQQLQKRNGTADGDEPQPTPEEAAQFEVADGVHKLETLLCNAIDKNFDLFELYVMDNILCVQPTARPWIRLQHYTRGLDFDAAAAAEEARASGQPHNHGPTAESVNAVRRNLQGSRRLNAMLRAEQAKNEALLTKLRAILGPGLAPAAAGDAVKTEEGAETTSPFAFLAARGDLTDADAKTPITTTAAFTLSQLQAMRSLSTSLRHILPDLGPAEEPDAGAGEGGRRGWRRERVEYVEGQTRRHLENVRGLELGEGGEVRDGEWQGEGRKFAIEEVEGLERVALVVGGEQEGSKEREEGAS
ncbi:Mis12 protein-domain-containing protein [Plectosphaerella cucumerina]|uniref:Mis12 protein-domain-containing protein n=1 Tax=Plectosphaerella cucumerina TaxID=40658 RepID=A0A8K0X1F8_9PEZI|nr:Mis12 protein-domain-containing protein [Plectosphaerella cucumerina]